MAVTHACRDGRSSQPVAVVGYGESAADIFHACEALRDAGSEHFDAHTPFPVHGLERAMGLPASKLPWIVLAGGITGLSGALALAYYTQEIAYKHVIGGKEAFSYQAFIPIFFELRQPFTSSSILDSAGHPGSIRTIRRLEK